MELGSCTPTQQINRNICHGGLSLDLYLGTLGMESQESIYVPLGRAQLKLVMEDMYFPCPQNQDYEVSSLLNMVHESCLCSEYVVKHNTHMNLEIFVD